MSIASPVLQVDYLRTEPPGKPTESLGNVNFALKLYAVYNMRNAGLEEAHAGLKIARTLSLKLDFISGKAKVPLDNMMYDEAEDHISFINKMRL